MHYYIIDRKIKVFSEPLDSNLYSYPELTTEQKDFYIANPGATLSEVLNTQIYSPYSPSLSDLKIAKKDQFGYMCQNDIIEVYPTHKQLNVSTLNGYNEDDLTEMKNFIANQRTKLSLLSGLVDGATTQEELNLITWEVELDNLMDLIISFGNSSSLQIAKLKKVEELKAWNITVQNSGYSDVLTGVTLASRESDISAFAQDLTGINSLIREASSNEDINLPATWPFIDINKNPISTLSPNQYVSLLNRYFIALRDVKISYSYYLYLIYIAADVESLNGILFGE